MIKFFRKIRQKLLAENRFNKYLFYAIGEIVLVVIGILIALQINNWNETRKDNLKANSYLLNIREDLKKDTTLFNIAIKELNKVTPNTAFLLEVKDFSAYEIDSLVRLLPIVYYEYELHTQTFDKLVNSGITELADDAKLFDKINNYYTNVANIYYSFRNWDIKDTNTDNKFFFNHNFEIPMLYSNDHKEFFSVQTTNEKLAAFSEMIFSVEARNKLRQSYVRKDRLAEVFTNTKEAAVKLITGINQKIK